MTVSRKEKAKASWRAAKRRCYDKNTKAYKDYGAKGIKMSDEWKNSFEAFYRDMGDRPKKHTLDRIDRNKGYTKDNCRWASHTIQNVNKDHKKSKTGFLNIHKNINGYIVHISREKYRRTRYRIKTIDEAIKIRDCWIKEYEEDRQKWIENTLNNSYSYREEKAHPLPSTSHKYIRKRNGKYIAIVFIKNIIRSSYSMKSINDAIKIRDEWLKEMEENEEEWIKNTINKNYKKEI